MPLLKRRRAGLGDVMSVVTRFVNACNRHDADGVYACLHPDFDSIQPMFPSRNFRGADQVRRNWQAIFDAEPGFRLTVLRSAVVDDTVWLELHGAGRDAEVAAVFVMGIQGDRIRWARIYSALVEPVEAAGSPSAAPTPVQEVPPLDGSPPAGDGEVVEEALIAPVVDLERSGRRRRRSSRRRGEGEAGGSAGASTAVVDAEPEPGDATTVGAPPVDDTATGATDTTWATEIEPEAAPEPARDDDAPPAPATTAAADAAPAPEPAGDDDAAPATTAAADAALEPADVISDAEPEPEAPQGEPAGADPRRPDPGWRRFGRRSR